MFLKEFLKPTKIKLILTILLLAPVAYYLFDKAFWFCRIVEEGFPVISMRYPYPLMGLGLDINCFLSELIPKIIISAIVIYFFSCLVERIIESVKRKQKKETAIWLACLICMAIIGVVAVLICRTTFITKNACGGGGFYEDQVLSLKYDVHSGYATVFGYVSSSRNVPRSMEESINVYPGQEFFYLNTGKEQTVRVRLEKIENNKAYFVFRYGAAPPACETVGGCDYICEFVKE